MLGVVQAAGVIAIEAGKCPVCGKDHGELKESKPSKADAGTLAQNFKRETEATVARGLAMTPKKKAYISPTMLGVVHCKCGNKYADQSAMTTMEFARAADSAGMTHRDASVSYLDGAKVLDEKYADKIGAVKTGLEARLGAAAVEPVWRIAGERADASLAGGPTAYPPGTCAAQGAFLVMLENGHNIATAMTEQWYHPKEQPTKGKVDFWDERDGARKPGSEPFAHNSTVPPCGACELIVPLLFCSEEKTECRG
ncbi:hypothetical protein OV079_10200 [Nannocystis pusilla]|uniref:Uncharacterized protein n=1 Tax=Nannocystis pusilla TaxID=889268 RepID=A0A9X3ESY1_9BACT|nr:hypothetical protein [Nannocystis pusilla]MCY1005931.1 hypothetical protein [Nannocystis pusilla]